jgi:hypothetical protein
MKDQIEAKITKLKENKDVVIKNMETAQEVLKKNLADLNAIQGAIQVCEQILEEVPKSKKKDNEKSDE